MNHKNSSETSRLIDIESQEPLFDFGFSFYTIDYFGKPMCKFVSGFCIVLILLFALMTTLFAMKINCPSPALPTLVKLYTYVDDTMYWVYMGTNGIYLYTGGDNFHMIPQNEQSLLFNLQWDGIYINQEMGLYNPSNKYGPSNPSNTPALFYLNPIAGSEDSWTISMNGSTDFLVLNPANTQIVLQSQLTTDAPPLVFYIIFGSFGAIV